MKVDFSKGKIYKVINDYNDDIYIGSTCDTLKTRFRKHQTDAEIKIDSNRPFYKLIREIGFNRFKIELIEDFPCLNINELRQREGHYIKELATLNKQIAGRTSKMYYNDNIDDLKEKKKIYNEKNKEKLKEKRKEWCENNKESIKEYNKKYSDEHKENLKEKRKIYIENNREKINAQRREWREKNKEKMKIVL